MGRKHRKQNNPKGESIMTANEYVISVINKHALPTKIDSYTEQAVITPLKRLVTNWAGNCLCEIKLSGSRAKGTAIDIATDLDLFISLSSTTSNSLSEIYDSLYVKLLNSGIKPRKQNVSIGVTYGGKRVDLVPGKRQSQYGNDHSLYKRKSDSWTKTNIDTHISNVIHSGRRNEILALKIWRENHGIEFPSILLETLLIEALKGRSTTATADNVLFLFKYLQDHISTIRVLDPANTNNVLSNDLSVYEKQVIAKQAEKSLSKPYWEQIIW